jgi:transketolase
MLATAVEAARILETRGLTSRVVSMPFVKPLDVRALDECADRTRCLVTLEEHSVLGGLGGAVSEHLAERGKAVRFRRLGADDRFSHTCGDQAYHRHANGLAPDQVVATVMALLS